MPLQAETEFLQDPLLNQERQRNNEDRVIFRCMTGTTLTDKDLQAIRLPRLPLVPLGRHGTHCNSWLSMPMGDIESPVRMASRWADIAFCDIMFCWKLWKLCCMQHVFFFIVCFIIIVAVAVIFMIAVLVTTCISVYTCFGQYPSQNKISCHLNYLWSVHHIYISS